jgi:putative membrane protein
MRAFRTLLAMLVAAGLLLGSASVASATGGKGWLKSHEGPRWPLSPAKYLEAAAAANQFAIQTGELAQQRGTTDAIRSLGATIAQDHTTLQQQGDAVATQLGLTITPKLSRWQERAIEKLSAASGEHFDHKWLKIQAETQELTLALVLRGAIRGEAPAIRRLAQDALPTVARNLGSVLDLADASKKKGRKHHGAHRGHKHGPKKHHGAKKHDKHDKHSHESRKAAKR